MMNKGHSCLNGPMGKLILTIDIRVIHKTPVFDRAVSSGGDRQWRHLRVVSRLELQRRERALVRVLDARVEHETGGPGESQGGGLVDSIVTDCPVVSQNCHPAWALEWENSGPKKTVRVENLEANV